MTENSQEPFPKRRFETAKESITFTPEEVGAIAGVIFGGEKSTIDKLVLWTGGSNCPKELTGGQKICLAPASAAEGLIKGVWEFNEDPGKWLVNLGKFLFDKKTYKNLARMIDMVADAEKRKVLQEALAKGWGNFSPEEKTAFITEVIFSNLMSGGVVAKLEKVISASKLATMTRAIADTASVAQKSVLVEELVAKSNVAKQGSPSSPHDLAFMEGAPVASIIPRTH
jgi:hypothetical protein